MWTFHTPAWFLYTDSTRKIKNKKVCFRPSWRDQCSSFPGHQSLRPFLLRPVHVRRMQCHCGLSAWSCIGVSFIFLCRVSTRALDFWSNDLVVPNFYSMRHAIFYAATHVWLKFFLQLICFQTKSEMSLLPRPPKPTDSSNTFGLRLASAVTFRPK